MTTPRPKQTLKHISTRRNMSSESTNIMKKAQEQKRYQQKKIAKFKTTDEPLYILSQQPILK